MKRAAILSVFVLAATAFAEGDAPSGWSVAGLFNKEYRAGVERGACYRGHACATLQSVGRVSSGGYAGLVQLFDADHFRGKRVRLTGYIRTEGVTDGAGLYLRVDGADRDWKNALAVDAMENRQIKASTAWSKYETVVDVDPTASQISLGALLHGEGKLWLASFSLEEVPLTVPTTGTARRLEPVNLDFEK
jgi:hypothetical protein